MGQLNKQDWNTFHWRNTERYWLGKLIQTQNCTRPAKGTGLWTGCLKYCMDRINIGRRIPAIYRLGKFPRLLTTSRCFTRQACRTHKFQYNFFVYFLIITSFYARIFCSIHAWSQCCNPTGLQKHFQQNTYLFSSDLWLIA